MPAKRKVKWKCTQCRKTIMSVNEPSSRCRIVDVYGVGETTPHKNANDYNPVCFGNERGEDYMQHDWRKSR